MNTRKPIRWLAVSEQEYRKRIAIRGKRKAVKMEVDQQMDLFTEPAIEERIAPTTKKHGRVK